MAVKVIYMGKKETTCHSCKSVLEYYYTDTKVETFYDYGGGKDRYRGIDCPVCKVFVKTERD